MRLAMLLLTLVACGGTDKPLADVRVGARDDLLAAVGKPEGFLRLMKTPPTNGGLWFADEACAKQFPPGEIPQDKVQAFAACLAKLPLQASAREDALGDVTVLTYEPGFEVEARMVPAAKGAQLTWIGFSARRPTDKLPSITIEALEGHRLTGDADGPLGAEAGSLLDQERTKESADLKTKRDTSYAWLKVCVDGAGAVTSVDSFEVSSPIAASTFTDAAKAWTFKPFEVNGTAIPVCAMARLSYPPGSAALPERLPMPPSPPRDKSHQPIVLGDGSDRLLEGYRIAGTRKIYPSDDDKRAMVQRKVSKTTGRFRVCIDEQGVVDQVLPMQSTGFADYDQRLMAGIRQWKYAPYKVNDQTVPVCTVVAFAYSQR